MTGDARVDDGYKGLRAIDQGLPSHYYFDPTHHERELKAIWYRHWIYLCRASALAEPRQYRTFEVGSQQVLLLRDESGQLQAFFNTCRHRGAQLCAAESGRVPGNRLVCPYHRWSYSLDGRLRGTSSLFRPGGFDPADYPLYRVAVAEWRGFVFVNLSERDQGPVHQNFDREITALDHWPLEDLVVGHTYRKTVRCNWKLFLENYNECLHCPGVHPELCDLVPIYGRGIPIERDDPAWRRHLAFDDPKYRRGLRPDAATWSMDGLARGVKFEGLSDDERSIGHSFITNVPSFYIVGHVNYVRAVRLRPVGPEQTEVVAEWLFPAETLKDPKFDLANIVDFATLVIDQDSEICELNQRGMRSLPHERNVLMPEEYLLKEFHEWIRAELQRL